MQKYFLVGRFNTPPRICRVLFKLGECSRNLLFFFFLYGYKEILEDVIISANNKKCNIKCERMKNSPWPLQKNSKINFLTFGALHNLKKKINTLFSFRLYREKKKNLKNATRFFFLIFIYFKIKISAIFHCNFKIHPIAICNKKLWPFVSVTVNLFWKIFFFFLATIDYFLYGCSKNKG